MWRTAAALLCAFVIPVMAADVAPSPYVSEQTREIKALSAQEMDDYLNGRGMGLARAAELNGYPGPAHVLELATQLQLSAIQRAATQALFASMQQQARAAGAELIAAERQLDRRFAHHHLTSQQLTEQLLKIGALQARVRNAHLQTHLQQLDILTPQQVTLYAQLRGYGTEAQQHHH